MTDIKVGDEVRVFYWGTRGHREHPEGFPGTVVKVAKKYGTARFARPGLADQEQEVRFDLATGFQSPDTEGLRMRTLTQIDEDERRKVALFHLDNAGIEFKFGRAHFFTLEQLEALAEVVKMRDQEGAETCRREQAEAKLDVIATWARRGVAVDPDAILAVVAAETPAALVALGSEDA